MKLPSEHRLAAEKLKRILEDCQEDEGFRELITAKARVLQRYQPMFTPSGIERLTPADFRSFLLLHNNSHWPGLDRWGPAITGDMNNLKRSLLELVDEHVPVGRRFENMLPGGRARVCKFGKAIFTPILLVSHPEKYVVWNAAIESSIYALDIWPEFGSEVSIGARYEFLCDLAGSIAEYLGTDIWTLDALWRGGIGLERPEPSPRDVGGSSEIRTPKSFGLERHLQDFLIDNWEQIEIGQSWNLVEEGGEVEGYGYERPTDTGRIDLLARHKLDRRWLVIELKRDQSTDKTVGQILRYMGWVKEKLAEPSASVEGLIISLDDDEGLRYALKVVPNVRFMRYKIEFRLTPGFSLQ